VRPDCAAGLARKMKKIAKNKWIYLPKKQPAPTRIILTVAERDLEI
jgi:hypothetical protein